MPGLNTLTVEVTNISVHGFWILVSGNEYFLDYTNYPWFKKATIEEICDLSIENEQHLLWRKLDVDLELSCIKNPGDYPLLYK
jgi:hypothetical protein